MLILDTNIIQGSDMTTINLTKLSKYHNKWVAISSDQKEIKGVGGTAQQALKKSKKNGEEDPILTKVPKDYSTYIL